MPALPVSLTVMRIGDGVCQYPRRNKIFSSNCIGNMIGTFKCCPGLDGTVLSREIIVSQNRTTGTGATNWYFLFMDEKIDGVFNR